MRIGVLTSGGDSPGMNAAVRTITAVGIGRNHEVIGIRSGFAGLLEGDTIKMDLPMVNGISAFGGTILGSARSGVFPTPDGQARACSRIRDLDLDALVIIGGNGSLTGAHKLAEQKPCLMAERLQEYLDEDAPGVDIRYTILGHVVRGGRPSAMDRVIAQRLAFGALLSLEHGLHDIMMSWDIETDFGQKTPDPHIRIIPLGEALAETERLLNGTSEVTKGRMALLNQVEDLLFL